MISSTAPTQHSSEQHPPYVDTAAGLWEGHRVGCERERHHTQTHTIPYNDIIIIPLANLGFVFDALAFAAAGHTISFI